MTWWILIGSAPTMTFNTITVRAFTNVPDHLYMAWAYWEPTRHLLYRTVRGKTILCGYKYIWDTPTITEQDQDDDTLYHTFHLYGLTANSTVWYYLFAPDGPYGLEIQGPLRHVHLPPPPHWDPNLFVATKLKGVFATRTFSGPGEPQPTWIPLTAGLHSLSCWQYAPDLLAPQTRHYLVTGVAGSRVVYKLDVPIIPWWMPFTPARFPDWQPILTNADCLALTGFASGEICWVATNINLPGQVYVLFHHPASFDGATCIRSENYGLTWQSFPISPGPVAQRAGNIIAGLSRGASPHASGQVLYAAINNGLMGSFKVYISTDRGETWALGGSTQTSVAVPRVMVEPSDHSIVYIGAHVAIPNPHELFRSTEHGANLVEVDGDHHLGFYLNAFWGQMWLDTEDIHSMRILVQNHVWTSTTFAATWTDFGPTAVGVARLMCTPHSPSYLHLGRRTNSPPFGDPGYPHVVFISTDQGHTMWGKAGDHADQPDGDGDSIPGDCGGLAYDGFLHPYQP